MVRAVIRRVKVQEPPQHASGASRRARRWASLSLGVACLALLVLTGRQTAQATLRGSGSSGPFAAILAGPKARPFANGSAGSFRIGGATGGLYPGDSKLLVLTVINPQHFAIRVTSIATTVGSAGPGCAAQNLTVAEFTGDLTVIALGSAQIAVPVTLKHAAPNACQGAVFPLDYTGLAVKA